MGTLRQNRQVRQLYMAYIDDGLMDIFIGCILLLAGLMMFTELFWMAGVYVAVLLPVVWSAKEKVTMPRLRREELSADTANGMSMVLAGFMIAGMLVMMLGLIVFLLLTNRDQLPVGMNVIFIGAAGLIAATLLAGMLLAGFAHKAPRFLAYVLIALGIGVVAWWLHIGLPWALMAFGAIVGFTGVVYLIRFLRSHPVLPEEDQPAW
jgi:hypothetical protein